MKYFLNIAKAFGTKLSPKQVNYIRNSTSKKIIYIFQHNRYCFIPITRTTVTQYGFLWNNYHLFEIFSRSLSYFFFFKSQQHGEGKRPYPKTLDKDCHGLRILSVAVIILYLHYFKWKMFLIHLLRYLLNIDHWSEKIFVTVSLSALYKISVFVSVG